MINRNFVLEKLEDKNYFAFIQEKVVNVVISGSIDKFANELHLTPEEAWEVYLQIKDVLLDGEVLGIILNTANIVNSINVTISEIDEKIQHLKEELNKQLRITIDTIENNFMDELTNHDLSKSGLRLITNITDRVIVESFPIPEHLTKSEQADVCCFGFGKLYSVSTEYDKAIEYYDKALSLKSDHIAALINKGEVYAKLGRPATSIQQYDKVYKLSQIKSKLFIIKA